MTEDQEIITMLETSAQHFIEECQQHETAPDHAELLPKIAELGLTGLALPESHGGSGLGLTTICAISRVFGQAALTTPFIGQSVLPSLILAKADASNSLVSSLCDQLNSAETGLALAWQERVNQSCGLTPSTQLINGTLNGSKRFVAGGATAGQLLMTASEGDTLHIIAVAANTSGISISTKFDSDLGFADVSFNNVSIDTDAIILSGSDAEAALSGALNAAQIAVAAELEGLAQGCLNQTLEFLKTRTQFKQALGSFQSIRHRCADLLMGSKLSESSWRRAVREYQNGNSELAQQQLHAAKARCGDTAFNVAKEAIQMHGAMGFTEEAGIGNYMRSALGLSSWMGSPQHHRHQLMQTNLPEVAANA